MMNEAVIVESDSNSNSDYSLQLNRWFLQSIGAWPSSPSTTKLEKIVSFILNIVCLSIVILAVIPSLLLMILGDESFNFKLKIFGYVSHWVFSGINYTALLTHGKNIRQCIEHIEADWRTVTREEDKNVMLKNAKLGRYIAGFSVIFVQGSVLCFFFVAALNTVEMQIGNETRVLHLLPCAVYKKLVNVDDSLTNEIMLLLQMWSTVIANSSTSGIFGLSAVLAAHSCGQLNVIMVWITEFVNKARERKKTGSFIEIGIIVERHLRTLNIVGVIFGTTLSVNCSFISCIEDVMFKIYFVEMFRSTMDICVIGYYILSEWADHDIQNLITYFMMLISICFDIFVICYISEILTEQCQKVGEVVYMTNWYYLPNKVILDLILIIARSSMVVQLTAGKFIQMSVYTFGNVLKTGFAYLNMLQQMTR